MILPHLYLTLRLTAVCFAVFTSVLFAADAKCRFDLTAADATETLPRFADQANSEIIFSPGTVRGVRTNAVSGEFTASEALDLLVARTGLVATRDSATGALAVRKGTPGPNVDRAESPAAGARPTNLHAAASHGSIYDVEGIIESGAIVDELDASGLSALHLAIHAGRLGVAALLVAKGADVNQGDTSQRTPLHHAAARGLKGALIVLIDLGASLTASDERGWTPLHEAAAAYQVPYDGSLFSTFLFRSSFVPFV